MARKTKPVDGKTATRKKKKKTTRKKTARIKTAAQIAQTDQAGDDESAIRNPQSAIETPPGIVCPRCGCRDLRAPDGRPWEITHTERKFGFIRRRRVCRYCGKVVITREKKETE